MNGGDEILKLNYDLIKRVAHGEREALDEILHIYEPYHNTLVIENIVGADGKIYSRIDEDKKVMIQMHLVNAIQKKWRKLI